MFSITLRNGLSPEADVVKLVGEADTYESAVDKAFAFINDESNYEHLKAKSFYVRLIEFKKSEIVGLDYGSHSRFIVISNEETKK